MLPSYLELAVAGVEAVLLIVVAVPLWARAVDQFPDAKDSTVIQIVAQQFAWNARYAGPDGIFGRQDMKFVSRRQRLRRGPDRPERQGRRPDAQRNPCARQQARHHLFEFQGRDPFAEDRRHAREAGRDSRPADSRAGSRPTKIGRYQINCAQLCGNGHAAMTGGFLVVESQADFDKWLKSKSGATYQL